MSHSMHEHMDHSMHAAPSPSAPMDHSAHNHAGHSHGMDMGGNDTGCYGMMMMYFHGGYCETILFDGWRTSTLGGLIGSMIGIMLMAAVYEGLKYYREYLFWKTYNSLQYRSMRKPPEASSSNEDAGAVNIVGEVMHKQPPRMMCLSHLVQTLLHMLQFVLAYFLMLIFMTYNSWLALAVTLGAGLGYFFFGWKKSVIVDVSEHCH